MALSPRQRFLYCAGEDRQVYCIDLTTNTMDKAFKVTESLIVGLATSVKMNYLAVYSDDGNLKLFKNVQ